MLLTFTGSDLRNRGVRSNRNGGVRYSGIYKNKGGEEYTPEQKVLWRLMQYGVADVAEEWVLLQFAAMPAIEIALEYFKNLVLPEWSREGVFEAEGLSNYLEDHSAESERSTLEEMMQALVDKGWLEAAGGSYMLPEAIRACIELRFETYAAYFVELIDALHLSYFGEEYGKVMGNALFVAHLKGLLPYLEYGEVYLTLQRLLIKTYHDLVNWNEEEKELKSLLDQVEQNEGKWTENYWNVCNSLSDCFRRIGNFTAADHFSQVQLEVAQKIYVNHPNLAVAQSERGLVLCELGDYNRAEQLFQLALDSDLHNFGSDHPNVVSSQSNLAIVYTDLEDYNRAVQLLQLALDSALHNFGSDHPSVARSQSNLARVYKELGDYSRAAQLLQLALDNDLRNFGSDHPNVARNQSNLATVYKELGDYSRAAQLLQLALDSNLRNFDPDHPNVAWSRSNLAVVYYDLDRLDEAKILWEQALQTIEKKLGVNHPHYAGIVSWLDDVNEKLNPSN